MGLEGWMGTMKGEAGKVYLGHAFFKMGLENPCT